MTIELHTVPVGELAEGYRNSDEEGVTGYGGRLNIRPPYQREFVYKDAQRDAVIETVRAGFPLNVMYWARNSDGSFEVLDGQQRAISLCQYVTDTFSVDKMKFGNLPSDKQEEILDYRLMVYFCEGKASEKLAWFETINIAGAVLTKQELRNAAYTGPWLADAKRYFSKTGCAAYGIGQNYVNGSPIRQEYLEAALGWISHGKIDEYMDEHRQEPNANELWLYFQSVINWVRVVFPAYRKEMKGVGWGVLYNKHKDKAFDSAEMEKEVSRLMADDNVTNKRGIYPYVLGEDEKHLSIRAFTAGQKRAAYEKQGGVCPLCNGRFDINEMEGDHIDPWRDRGKTKPANLQMLCKPCNRRKAGK
ncbi:MAG: DUF262 domain-containing protein [Spirochaetaceae bacterium]|jgi:hypothetical protein|nr:DUF262 domain-containing protein [Spirochaetaceae bacterium]